MTGEPVMPMDDAARIARIGWISCAAVFGGLALWSVAAPIDSAVIAPGQITVEANRKTVQHLDGGVVGEILVREGDKVEAGDVLIRIDDTAALTNDRVLTSQLAEGIARYARLLAERDGLDEIGADSLAFALAPPGLDYASNLEGQKSLLAARIASRKNQIELLQERIVQQEERISGLRKQVKSLAAQARLIADELDGVRRLNAEGFAPMTRVRELERGVEAIAGQQGQASASIAEAQSLIAGAKLEIEGLSQTARIEAAREAQDLQVQVAGLIEKSTAARAALDRTEIRAPESGVVLALRVHTIGGVIAPGAALMDIVPDAGGLRISAQVSPLDVDKVRPGQRAVIRFSALNARTTPEAEGEVRLVSADNLVEEGTSSPYYLVLIDLPPDEILNGALRGQKLVPGMPVDSFIQTGSRPAISYLLKPLTDAFSGALRED